MNPVAKGRGRGLATPRRGTGARRTTTMDLVASVSRSSGLENGGDA